MNSSSPKTWFVVAVSAIGDANEAIEYGLMEAGALGTETDDRGEPVTVRGYFENKPNLEVMRENLNRALRIYEFASSAILNLDLQEIANRDWLAEWKKSWQPVQVGRFVIAPPWSEPPAVAGGPNTEPILIRINPGMAFGTGTHETTRLCLKAIEKYFRGGSFLDVGTGTGILAIAAAKMRQKPDREGGPLEIRALDVDEDAITIAKENADLNRVAEQIDFRIGTVDEQTPSADFVCANLTAPVIVELLPALIAATCGRLILSGILDSQIEMVRSGLAKLGVADAEIDQDGEWVALMI